MFRSVVVGIFVLLIAIAFSGCIQTDNVIEQTINVKGDTDKVEITSYAVTTIWIISDSVDDGAFYNHSGFYHDYPDNVHDASFDVKGTIKNIAGEHLDTIEIIAFFCDANNKTLAIETTTIHDLSSGNTEAFHVYVALIETLYFKDIDSVKFEVSVS